MEQEKITHTSCAFIGQHAPSFEGEAFVDGNIAKINSEDYKGKWLVFFFYPLDFTFVCPTEITAFSDAIEEFTGKNAAVLGCSVDSVHSHKAWVEGSLGKINYPLLSDITKNIARDYGVLLADEGVTLRGTFIIDPDGNLKYSVIHDNNVGRSVEETLRVLDALQTGGLCPANWHKGEKTLEV